MRIQFHQGIVVVAEHASGWVAFFEDRDVLGEGDTMMSAIADLNEKEKEDENH